MTFPHPLPFDGKPPALRMGLRGCPEDEWLEPGEDYAELVAERRRLLAERHAEVFRALPGSEAAGAETLELVTGFMARRRPGGGPASDGALHPLDRAGRLTAEDLCLMQPAPGAAPDQGPYLLTAASLCFPTRWRLADKIGRPLREIHAPVPGFDERLGRAVDRFFAKLEPGHVVQRVNWGLNDSAALFQPAGHFRSEPDPSITPETAGARLRVRMERQTLRRLERTGAVLFTIRIHQPRLDRVAADPEAAAKLAGSLRALPHELRQYKSVGVYWEAVLAYLDERAKSEPKK